MSHDGAAEDAVRNGRLLWAGPPLEEATAVAVLLHGRGGTASDMLSLTTVLEVDGVAYVAPQAPGNSWYPHGFLEPLERNEPRLTHSLRGVGELLARLGTAGIPAERSALVGFSQGGCLALEFVARHARRYGAVAGLSAGLIGPEVAVRDHGGDLAGTPVFLGCSDRDPHVPLWRVKETTRVLTELGASVEERVYPGLGHTVNLDEVDAVRELLGSLTREANDGRRRTNGG